MAIDNLYGAMPLLVNRLRDQLPWKQADGVRTIDATDMLASNEDVTTYCPAVFVMPSPMDAQAQGNRGRQVIDGQEYQVTVCVASIKNTNKPAAVDLAAGKIMFQVFQALAGYAELGIDYFPVEYTGRGAPLYGAGYAEYPLFFKVNAVIGSI